MHNVHICSYICRYHYLFVPANSHFVLCRNNERIVELWKPIPPVRETERILTDEEAAERAARKEAAREARRKKKQRKKCIKTALLIVLAVILVIVAAFAGFLLYLQKCGTEYDNITECVQSQPMDFTQRYAFSSADKTMSVRLDKNDLWWSALPDGRH